jgi:sigma-B regulation protein RsbU (phosphoserine phosphatase)
VMAKLSSDIRFCLLSEPDPARAMARLNDLLHEFTSRMDRFVTVGMMVLDPATHTATLLSGGHGSPLLYRPSTGELAAAMPRDVGGPPLGMIEGLPFDSCQVALQPGETLILYTDGVDESMNTRGEKFRLEGIERVVKASGDVGPRELGERLVAAVKQHATNRDPHDDVTIVLVGRRA